MKKKKLTRAQTKAVETLREPSALKPDLEALKVGEALLIDRKDWKYKSAPRTLVHDIAGPGKFSVKMTKDKKSWFIEKIK